MNPKLFSRRYALKSMACGFGYLALAGLAAERAFGVNVNPLAPKVPHFKPHARRVVFIFMQGGPSHVDTFDHKPLLEKNDGKMMGFDDARALANTGARGTSQRVLKSPWAFARHGQSGRWVSELFPEMAKHVDDLCFIHSMQTEGVAHGPATLFLHCGSTTFIRPSMGSWVTYGLGTENENLPGFVTSRPRPATAARATTATPSCRRSFKARPLARPGCPRTNCSFAISATNLRRRSSSAGSSSCSAR